jgi:GST-like protein
LDEAEAGMIDLYGTSSPNVAKISIMLEEVGLAYRLCFVDVFGEGQYDADFLAISPTNRVPAIVDHDVAEGPLAIFESGAILIHLAERTGALLARDGAARSAALQWMMYQMTTIGPMGGQLIHFSRFAPAGDGYPKARYRSQINHVHAVLDRRLAGATFLAGHDFSIADVATYPWIRHVGQLSKDDSSDCRWPALARWFTEVGARPGVARGMAALDSLKEPVTDARSKANADSWDRFFLRGRYAATSGPAA